MTSPAKLTANRRNGARSRGPRTVMGLARSAQNARKHGLTAAAVVLPVVERAADYEEHREAVLADLAPLDGIEHELAERVVVLMWRLRRVARYEAAELGEVQHGAEGAAAAEIRGGPLGLLGDVDIEKPADMAEARESVTEAEALVKLVEGLAGMPDDAPAPGGDGIVWRAALLADVDLDELDIPLPGVPDDAALEDVPWTAGLLRLALDTVAEAGGMTVLELVDEVKSRLGVDLYKARQNKTALEAAIRARRGRGLFLADDLADKVSRYEGHLERALYRTLHELERRQSARQGGPVFPPIAVDVTVGRHEHDIIDMPVDGTA